MREEEEIRKRIRERLASYPKYKCYCSYCKKYLCTMTVQVELICLDCWLSRQPPPERSLLLQLIDELSTKR
jgi:hypothetical protein